MKKSRVNNRELIDNAIKSFEKGEVEHMTYAIERIFDEAEEKGIVRGLVKGREEVKIEIAKELLAEGEPLERIAKLVKFPLETIKALVK